MTQQPEVAQGLHEGDILSFFGVPDSRPPEQQDASNGLGLMQYIVANGAAITAIGAMGGGDGGLEAAMQSTIEPGPAPQVAVAPAVNTTLPTPGMANI